MDSLTSDILGIPKGSRSLAEAFKELELVREAFQRASRIEHKILENESSISQIQGRMELLSTTSYVDTKTEKLKIMIDSMVKSKFDEYTSHILFELNRKINDFDAKKLIDGKVNWGAFNDLKNIYGTLKLKVDTHVDMEFVNYKGKVSEEFQNQRKEFMEKHKDSTREIEDLRQKFDELMEKVQEVLAEDEESVKSMKSEEDFEKMMIDLEKHILPESPRERSIKKIDSDKPSRLNTLPNKEASISPLINPSIRKSVYKETSSPLVGFVDPEIADVKNTEFFGGSVSPTYRKSRQEVYSRKSSVTSTTGGGIKQLSRKLAVMEKDISDIFIDLRGDKKKFEEILKEIKKIHQQIADLNNRCDRMEEFEKKMEFNFVNRLRNKDMQNTLKKNNVLFERLPDEDISKLQKEIQIKNKKIVQMDYCLKYLVTEIDFLKSSHQSKFKDLQEGLSNLEKGVKHKEKDSNMLRSTYSNLEHPVSEALIRPQEEPHVARPAFSASHHNKNETESECRGQMRRKSQDPSKHLKEEWSKLLAGAEKVSEKPQVRTNHRVSSATPKVSNQGRLLFT